MDGRRCFDVDGFIYTTAIQSFNFELMVFVVVVVGMSFGLVCAYLYIAVDVWIIYISQRQIFIISKHKHAIYFQELCCDFTISCHGLEIERQRY